MEQKIAALFHLHDECVRLCTEFRDILENERIALIYLKTDSLLEMNFQKEDMLQQLVHARRQFREGSRILFGTEKLSEIEAHLPEELKEEWRPRRQAWMKIWEETYRSCELSVLFIGHSQKNLALFSENLKRLFGEQPLYSAQGRKVDKATPGRVVEGKY